MEPLVSVVVPVYNVEKYLDRCMRSIVNQTYRNLEIILVDDGSPDSCPAICDEWANRDSRICVIHKENAGLGMARNTGIEHATGEYICFVDSDDYIDLDTIELSYCKMQETGADIVLHGAGGVPIIPKDVYCGREIREDFLPNLLGPDREKRNFFGFSLSACRVLIAMKLIQAANWRFVSERKIISEDYYSMLALYRYIDKVAVVRKTLYHYCYNGESLSHSYRADRCEKNRRFYLECIELCKKNGYPAEVERRVAAPYLNAMIAAMKQTVCHYDNPFEAVNALRLIIKDDVLQRVLRETKNDYANRKKKILFWAMRHKCGLLCYILLKAKLSKWNKKQK